MNFTTSIRNVEALHVRDVTNNYWWISEVTPLQISHNEVHQYSRTNERIQFVEELWLSNKSGAVLEPLGQLKSMQNIVPGSQNKF